MQVHHCKDEDEVSPQGIDYAIRETPDLASTKVIFESSPGVGETEDILNRGVDFKGDIVDLSRFAAFIVIYGHEKFRLRFGMKPVLHLVNRLRALSNTTSPGTGFTFPERRSWRRLFATSVHLASMPVSGIFRLRKSESAISARSSTGRDRASSIIFLVVIVN